MDEVTIQIGRRWANLAISPAAWIATSVSGVSVTFAPAFLYLYGQGREPVGPYWFGIPLCWLVILGSGYFHHKLACHVVQQLKEARASKTEIPQFEQFTDRARLIVNLASTESHRLGHPAVDTVHLLIGMVREGKGIAALVLARHGITTPVLLGAHASLCDRADVSLSVVEIRGQKEASWFKHSYSGTEHLLLGLCCLKASRASRLLGQLEMSLHLCQSVVENLGHSDEWDRWLSEHPEMTSER